MDYESLFRAYVREVVRIFHRLVEEKLTPFAVALEEFVNRLLSQTLPADWRDRLAAHLAEWDAKGYRVEAVGLRRLENWIEGWARLRGLLPTGTSSLPVVTKTIAAPIGVPSSAMPTAPKRPAGTFEQQLASAHGHLEEIGRLLEACGQRLDAAKIGEAVDVEGDVDAVEDRIWRYNDAIESALDAWLRDNLPGDALMRVYALPTPGKFALPHFVDGSQLERYRRQAAQIGQRLGKSDVLLGRIATGMQVLEMAGTVAGIALGGGMLLTAAKKGGAWAVVKTLAVAGGTALAEQGIERALRAAGVSEQSLHGVRLAAAVVTFILLRRRKAGIPEARALPERPRGNIISPSISTNSVRATTRRFWVRWIEFRRIKVYRRTDLINLQMVDSRGRTNLERMRAGRAPLGPDGEPMNLHHLLQDQKGPLAEMTEDFHVKYRQQVHINPGNVPSAIDRAQFRTFREAYWKHRASEFDGGSQ